MSRERRWMLRARVTFRWLRTAWRRMRGKGPA